MVLTVESAAYENSSLASDCFRCVTLGPVRHFSDFQVVLPTSPREAIFLSRICFRAILGLQKIKFPYTPPSSILSASPMINIVHSCGTHITIDESMLIHYYQLISIVYIRVRSLGCIVL